METWTIVPRFQDYEISSWYRVRRVTAGQGAIPYRTLVVKQDECGYLCVRLISRITNQRHRIRLHQIVAEIFYGPRPLGKEVNHKDGNKLNMGHGNLEYVTHRVNCQHWPTIKDRTGRLPFYCVAPLNKVEILMNNAPYRDASGNRAQKIPCQRCGKERLVRAGRRSTFCRPCSADHMREVSRN